MREPTVIDPTTVTERRHYAPGEAVWPDDEVVDPRWVCTRVDPAETGYGCTRSVGHSGAHVACAQRAEVCVVWPWGEEE